MDSRQIDSAVAGTSKASRPAPETEVGCSRCGTDFRGNLAKLQNHIDIATCYERLERDPRRFKCPVKWCGMSSEYKTSVDRHIQ